MGGLGPLGEKGDFSDSIVLDPLLRPVEDRPVQLTMTTFIKRAGNSTAEYRMAPLELQRTETRDDGPQWPGPNTARMMPPDRLRLDRLGHS